FRRESGVLHASCENALLLAHMLAHMLVRMSRAWLLCEHFSVRTHYTLCPADRLLGALEVATARHALTCWLSLTPGASPYMQRARDHGTYRTVTVKFINGCMEQVI